MCVPYWWCTKHAQLIMGTWPIYKKHFLQLILPPPQKNLSFDNISPRDFYFFPFFSICTCYYITQGWFQVCTHQMWDVITKWRLSLAGHKPRISPAYLMWLTSLWLTSERQHPVMSFFSSGTRNMLSVCPVVMVYFVIACNMGNSI